MGRKGKAKKPNFENVIVHLPDEASRPRNSSHHSQPSVIRKQVDPETLKYFSDIANLFENGEVDLEERLVICGNALEETKGKEFELATDYVISHTLQTLLDGCDLDHLCAFVHACGERFPLIAMDRSGSHVAETALKALALHLQDDGAYSAIEDTLTIICKVIVVNSIDMMCNCYASHVLRSLLCLCGGVPLDSPQFHGAKPSTVLAKRLNLRESRVVGNGSPHHQQGFPGLLKFLVSEMLNCANKDIKILQVNQYSSLVLQTALKLLAGDDQHLLQIILILIGCKRENAVEGRFVEMTAVHGIIDMMKETAYSRLMEVMLEVTSQSLYDEMFSKIFVNSLFELSSHHCGNFVIQALVSRARNQEQMEVIWEELGSKFTELLEMGRSGVVASIIAASQRLHSHEQKCCQALAAAVCLPNESPRCIVPRILFLDSYFSCEDVSTWNWPNSVKMHVMGSLILQSIFKFQSDFIQPYIMSLTYLEVDHVFEAAKDASGARVIEAFLGSIASVKQKRRLIVKLRGYFGELALHSSGSFTVEKCFTASNLSLREAIATDLLAVQTELSKTKQGPYLLRKLDIDRFASQPDQWRSKQASKQSTYKEFYAEFGSKTGSSKSDLFLVDTPTNRSGPKDLRKMREEIDHNLTSKKYSGHATANDIVKVKSTKATPASGKAAESADQVPFLSVDRKGRKRHRKNMRSNSSKKLKV